MRNYEITFIVDSRLSSDEIKNTKKTYVNHLKSEGASIVHEEDMGLKQLAYPILKRSTGHYFCVEFSAANGEFLANTELALRRDERILRYLTVRLDKHGVQYNADKRAGKIGKGKSAAVQENEAQAS